MKKPTPVTNIFLLLCLGVSVPSAFFPQVFDLFSGELPHEYWFQHFTLAFQHGARGMPLAILGHLAVNIFLLLTCSRLVERLLGSGRFLLLSLVAWGGYALAQQVCCIWINGASGIIWAYSPFLLLPIRWSRSNPQWKRTAGTCLALLLLMWGAVTLALGLVPFLSDPGQSLMRTFFFGNLFHLTATAIGFVFFALWSRNLSSAPGSPD
jgi:membrane associated rhomboid family serine protease